MAKSYKKDPNAVLDYGWDWSAWLGEDTIADSMWTVPDGIVSEQEEFTNTTTTIWLSGGTIDTDYTLINHITTSNTPPREDDRTMVIKVREK